MSPSRGPLRNIKSGQPSRGCIHISRSSVISPTPDCSPLPFCRQSLLKSSPALLGLPQVQREARLNSSHRFVFFYVSFLSLTVHVFLSPQPVANSPNFRSRSPLISSSQNPKSNKYMQFANLINVFLLLSPIVILVFLSSSYTDFCFLVLVSNVLSSILCSVAHTSTICYNKYSYYTCLR